MGGRRGRGGRLGRLLLGRMRLGGWRGLYGDWRPDLVNKSVKISPLILIYNARIFHSEMHDVSSQQALQLQAYHYPHKSHCIVTTIYFWCLPLGPSCVTYRPRGQAPSRSTVRAEIITELILERADPLIFKIFLLELRAFRLIPLICPARRATPENHWKRSLIPNKAYPAIKSVFSQR